jgi:hypothetical protein
MKWGIAILLCAAAVLAQDQDSSARSQSLPKALASVLSEVKSKSHIPLLLPSELPRPIATAEYAIVAAASEDEYAISLYYELGIGNAGFAASFGAKAHPDYGPKDIPNVREVRLSRGVIGYFRPVSCGGSCAPANLWWKEGQTLYLVQLELPAALPEGDKRRMLISVADSAILAGPR